MVERVKQCLFCQLSGPVEGLSGPGGSHLSQLWYRHSTGESRGGTVTTEPPSPTEGITRFSRCRASLQSPRHLPGHWTHGRGRSDRQSLQPTNSHTYQGKESLPQGCQTPLQRVHRTGRADKPCSRPFCEHWGSWEGCGCTQPYM